MVNTKFSIALTWGGWGAVREIGWVDRSFEANGSWSIS